MTARETPDAFSAIAAPPGRRTLFGRLRLWLFTGLLVLAPSAVTLYVFYRLLNAVDNLLGRYLRFAALDYHRIPGAGLLATLLLLAIVGAVTSRFGSGPLGRLWDHLLMRIPGVGILYGSTKSLGEALLTPRQQPFRRVVLVPWPAPGAWVSSPASLRRKSRSGCPSTSRSCSCRTRRTRRPGSCTTSRANR